MVKSIVAFYESQEKNGHNFRFFINLRRKLSSENFCRKRQTYNDGVEDQFDKSVVGVRQVASEGGSAHDLIPLVGCGGGV